MSRSRTRSPGYYEAEQYELPLPPDQAFKAKLATLADELATLNAEARILDEQIAANLTQLLEA